MKARAFAAEADSAARLTVLLSLDMRSPWCIPDHLPPGRYTESASTPRQLGGPGTADSNVAGSRDGETPTLTAVIHDDHPFLPGPEDRDPIRRFRGRLTAPVTIVTAGDETSRAGVTVSSLFVVEGDPGQIQLVLGPVTDTWDAVSDSGRFVVHICRAAHRVLAEVFAGRRPNPGGVFAGLDLTYTPWGPVLSDLEDRVFCSVVSLDETGYSGIVTATVDSVELSELMDPLVYFRGNYRGIRDFDG